MEKINNTENRGNPQSEAWGELADLNAKKGRYIETPDGKRIHESEYDAYMEAKEREDYYKSHPEARDMEKLYDRLEEMDNNPDRLDNFEGETNTNKNGKTRSFSEWDAYPIMKGEKSKEFGERAKRRHQMQAQFGNMATTDDNGMRTEEYLGTKQGQSELEAEKDFDALTARIDKAVAEGKMTEEAARQYLNDRLEKATQNIDSIRQSFNDHQRESVPGDDFQPPVPVEFQSPALSDSEFQPAVPVEFQPPVSIEQNGEEANNNTPEQESKDALAKRAIDEIVNYGTEELGRLDHQYEKKEISKAEYEAKAEAMLYALSERISRIQEMYPGSEEARKEAIDLINIIKSKYESKSDVDSKPNIDKQPDVLALEDKQGDILALEDKQGDIIDGQDQNVDNNHVEGEDTDGSKEKDDESKQERLEKSKEAIKEMLERAIAASKAAGNEHLKNAEAILEKIKALDGDKEKSSKGAERAQEIKDLNNQIKEAKKELKQREENLAESYAKNRGLFVGSKNRTEYIGNKQKYGDSLTKYLQLEARLKYLEGYQKNEERIQATYDKLAQDIENGKTSPEDAGKALSDEWIEISKKLQTDVSTQFVEQFIKENKNLENKTIDRIDNGNLYRKVVSKIIDNKALKVALGVAGAAALTATGIGVATGAVAATLSYTTGGILAGAARGALSGAIMSRQSSKNSVVRGFVNEDEIRQKLESIDAVNNDQDVKNVTDWLMGQYDTANKADRSSNRKRTLISTAIGATMGGAMSGVHLEKPVSEHESYNKIIGHEPTEKHAALINEVDHAKGTGTQQLFRELNGDGDSYFSSGAHDMMQDVLSKYEMTPDVYTGKLADWPETARIAYTEVADEWAKHGLVDAIETGGGPIYDTYGYTVNNIITDGLSNFFTQAGTAATAGALGGAISRIRNRIRNPEPVPNVTPAAEPTSPLEQAPTQPDQAPDQTGNAAPAEDYDAATRNAFQGRVNEDVLNYMTSDNDYNGLDGNMMQGRLMDVPQDVRREIAEYMDSHSDEPHGRALRQVIDLMRQNGQI